MKFCSHCKGAIWPRKKVTVEGCSIHHYHLSCLPPTCVPCKELRVATFLKQGTENDLKKHYDNDFVPIDLIKQTNDKNIIKFLVKKINVHKALVDCMTEKEFKTFKKIVENGSIDLYSTYKDKNMYDNITIEPYLTILKRHAPNQPQEYVPPIPPRSARSHRTTAKPPAPDPPLPVRQAPETIPTYTPPSYSNADYKVPFVFALPSAPPSYAEAVGLRIIS